MVSSTSLSSSGGDFSSFLGAGTGTGPFSFGGAGAGLISSSAALLLSSLLIPSYQPAEGIITFISLQSSYNWYLHLSQFETVFLGYIMLQICFFRYLELLPVNVNNFFLGMPSGRRRRRRRRKRNLWGNERFDCNGDIFLPSLFKVLKRLDDGNCLARTLCELESMSCPNTSVDKRIQEETSGLLSALKTSAQFRQETEKHVTDVGPGPGDGNDNYGDGVTPQNCEALRGLQLYEDAVLIGSSVAYYHNSTICEDSYSACPLTKQDIEHYIGVLINANML